MHQILSWLQAMRQPKYPGSKLNVIHLILCNQTNGPYVDIELAGKLPDTDQFASANETNPA